MRDLRLIGVHDDGEHLVVTDDTGEQFRLRIDEQLRAAARRDRPRLGQLQIAIDNNVRPREVQAMIRAGATADEVAARTGWDLDKVIRFEGPVIAEREHVAGRAQTVRMRGTNQAGAPATLAQRATTRLNGRGVDPASVGWDACRDADGQWTVSAAFTAGGRERTATWWFDQAGMSVVAKNDEAKWLSEADAAAGPLPAAVHRPTAVFDVEVEETKAERSTRANPDDLIASMREHSGAKGRRGGRRRTRAADATPQVTEDPLPLETEDEQPPAARGPHPKDLAVEDGKDTSTKTVSSKPGTSKADKVKVDKTPAAAEATGTPQPEAEQPATSQPTTSPQLAESTTTTPPTDEAKTGQPTKDASAKDTPAKDVPEQDVSEQADSPAGDGTDADQSASQDDDRAREAEPKDAGDAATDTTGKSRSRKGRASVPSWDDVMFGTRRG